MSNDNNLAAREIAEATLGGQLSTIASINGDASSVEGVIRGRITLKMSCNHALYAPEGYIDVSLMAFANQTPLLCPTCAGEAAQKRAFVLNRDLLGVKQADGAS